jgi:hypothetical protein
MNQQAEIRLNVSGMAHGWRTSIGRLLALFAAVAAVALLLAAESQMSSERRQQAFEASGVYP